MFLKCFIGKQMGCDGFDNITAIEKTPIKGKFFPDGTQKYQKTEIQAWNLNKDVEPPLYTGCPHNSMYYCTYYT